MSVRGLRVCITIIMLMMIVPAKRSNAQQWAIEVTSYLETTGTLLCPVPARSWISAIPEDRRELRLRFLPSEHEQDRWTIDTLGADSVVRWLADHVQLRHAAEPKYDDQSNVIAIGVSCRILTLAEARSALRSGRVSALKLIPIIQPPSKADHIIEDSSATDDLVTAPGFEYHQLVKHVTYPDHARRLNIEGTVRVHALIDSTGDVSIVQLRDDASAGPCALRGAAINAVLKMTYSPATKAGRPTRSWVVIPIVFGLR